MNRPICLVLICVVILFSGFSCGGGSSRDILTNEYVGVCASASQSPYVLPYAVGTSYVVYQGYPPFVHPPSFKFALDFTMASRTIVVAARAGTVQFIEQSFEDNDYTTGHENLVVIDHGDGTYARYVHLVKNGALVQRGDSVARGQSVGLSGATGSGVEHLHFDITTGCSQRECQTIAACFSNTRAHPNGLQRGESYRAEAY